MKKKKKTWMGLPFFVLIFSAYPSLALLATNIREVEAGVVARPLLASFLGTALLVVIFWAFFKDWIRASFATAMILVPFFSYGHITRVISDRLDPDLYTVTQVTIYLVFVGLTVLAIRWILRKGSRLRDWTGPVNMIGIALILFPVMQISGFALGIGPAAEQVEATPAPTFEIPRDMTTEPSPTGENPNQYPDVYLIVLDGYSRADTLEALGFDNSEFLNSLEGLGFYVAQCSRSNYRHTLLSMSSTFSMDLLWRAIPNSGPADTNTAPLYDALIHNTVRNDFEQRGYAIVGFQTGYQWDQWTDADYYLVPGGESSPADQANVPSITPFEYIFLKNTAVYPFVEKSSLATQRFYGHYNQVNFTLDELPKVATEIPGPKFTYAHIMSPHTPYIFLPDGSLNKDSRFYNTETGTPSNPKLQAEGYINNIRFLNSRMLTVLDEIIKNSKIPPIIILQGDHGYVLEERRYNNLMAFHFPNGGNASLYPTITPINTFRLVSNLYFGTNLELRNDVSNESDIGHPYLQKRAKSFPETCP